MEQTPISPENSRELPSVEHSSSEVQEASQTNERSDEKRNEQHESRGDNSSLPSSVSSSLFVSTSFTQSTVVDSDGASQGIVTLPTVASDEELIEKEWVSKAKQVIEQTKGDPHKREQEVNRLQVEYLSKRYGRDLGTER